MKRRLLLLLFMLWLINSFITGQTIKDKKEVYFVQSVERLQENFKTNQTQLDSILSVLKEIQTNADLNLSKITITGYASPEGPSLFNEWLGQKRAMAAKAYIQNRLSIPDSLFCVRGEGVAWLQLREWVEQSDLSDKKAIIDIIDSVPETIRQWDGKVNRQIDYRKKVLMAFKGGKPFNEMLHLIFPKLRVARLISIAYKTKTKAKAPIALPQIDLPKVKQVYEMPALKPYGVKTYYKPVLAIKSNLLFDLALTPNVEVELPIGSHFSLNAEFMRGWFMKKRTFCWEIESYGLEGRYWFRGRKERPLLTGWFVGGFISSGYYDFQLDDIKGIQGEVKLLTGLSGGYSAKLSREFRLEFSAGVGYMINNYRRYTAINNHYLLKDGDEHRLKAILPAKAKISLVWLIHRKIKKQVF